MNEMGLGSRVVNYLVDNIVCFIISYALYKWYSFYVFYWAYKFFPFYLFFFATVFVYYTLFEWLTGRSAGKYLTFTIVKTIDGRKPSLPSIMLRSLLRLTIIDPFFIPFFNRPLHDAISKTRVVELQK